jgi:hypothetical protein
MSDSIIPTCDSKTRFFKGDKNTFGLLPGPVNCGGTCPWSTYGKGGCREIRPGRTTATCYVEKLMRFRPAAKAVLKHNTELLMSCRRHNRVQLFDREFERYHIASARAGLVPGYYRIHWAGDCPDNGYAMDLAEAMSHWAGEIRFWGYSRALFTVPVMATVPNVRWYVSTDPVNADLALKFLREICWSGNAVPENVSVAYMGDELLKDEASRAFTACPVDTGAMSYDGACAKCRLCMDKGNVPIWFRRK